MTIKNPLKTILPKHLNLEDIIRKIERKYRERLVHKGTWIGKIAMLDVEITLPTFSNLTRGYFYHDVCDNEVRYKILLTINPYDSVRYIASVIAHEFAHLLFIPGHNFFDQQLKDGNKTSGSSFQHTVPGTHDSYGTAIEEAAADLAAMYIISHCRFPDKDDFCTTFLKWEDDMFASLGRRFAEIFGSPLEELSHFDAFSYEKVRIYEDDPRYAEMGDYIDPPRYDNGPKYHTSIDASLGNPFWYAAATCSFRSIIHQYESCMGEGSYRELCRDFAFVHKHLMDHFPLPPHILKKRSEAEEHRKRIEQGASENLKALLKKENSSEKTAPADPETIHEAYRRAMNALDRFEELYNALYPEEESADSGKQDAEQD